MKARGIARIDVELTDEEAVSIAIETICKFNDWDKRWYIEDCKVVFDEVYHTTHSWTETINVRDAEPIDYAINAVLKTLR
jgi:hypothetical protein